MLLLCLHLSEEEVRVPPRLELQRAHVVRLGGRRVLRQERGDVASQQSGLGVRWRQRLCFCKQLIGASCIWHARRQPRTANEVLDRRWLQRCAESSQRCHEGAHEVGRQRH